MICSPAPGIGMIPLEAIWSLSNDSNTSKPMQKRIQPLARALGITVPVTFQVMRRSAATRNQKNGSIKDVQAHMGHASVETTGNIYMQQVSDSVREMVENDVRDVMQTKTVQ